MDVAIIGLGYVGAVTAACLADLGRNVIGVDQDGVKSDAIAAGLLILSLFGWASVKTGWALRATLLLAGYGAMLALFARADTFYWALIPAPLAFVGLAFLPKALSDLAKAMRHTPYPAT